jgi:hypothetical protein
MTSKTSNEQIKTVRSVTVSGQEFNFEAWAKQVRPQLLASLSKRGHRL